MEYSCFNRVNESNDTIPAYEDLQLQNSSIGDPTTPQLHINQAYDSQRLCHNPSEPIYETIEINKAGQMEMTQAVGYQYDATGQVTTKSPQRARQATEAGEPAN